MELGLLIIRAAVGLTLAAHGAQKLFGSFGGHGLALGVLGLGLGLLGGIPALWARGRSTSM